VRGLTGEISAAEDIGGQFRPLCVVLTSTLSPAVVTSLYDLTVRGAARSSS
jgi:hypothetical protein